MRPHNSAHWTIEGARTSQFEQHLRAVLDYPLGVDHDDRAGGGDGEPARRTGRRRDRRASTSGSTTVMPRWPDVKIHLYGKGFRPGRKVGHVTALGTDLDDVRGRARAAADYLMNGGELP